MYVWNTERSCPHASIQEAQVRGSGIQSQPWATQGDPVLRERGDGILIDRTACLNAMPLWGKYDCLRKYTTIDDYI